MWISVWIYEYSEGSCVGDELLSDRYRWTSMMASAVALEFDLLSITSISTCCHRLLPTKRTQHLCSSLITNYMAWDSENNNKQLTVRQRPWLGEVLRPPHSSSTFHFYMFCCLDSLLNLGSSNVESVFFFFLNANGWKVAPPDGANLAPLCHTTAWLDEPRDALTPQYFAAISSCRVGHPGCLSSDLFVFAGWTSNHGRVHPSRYCQQLQHRAGTCWSLAVEALSSLLQTLQMVLAFHHFSLCICVFHVVKPVSAHFLLGVSVLGKMEL